MCCMRSIKLSTVICCRSEILELPLRDTYIPYSRKLQKGNIFGKSRSVHLYSQKVGSIQFSTLTYALITAKFALLLFKDDNKDNSDQAQFSFQGDLSSTMSYSSHRVHASQDIANTSLY